MLNKRTKFGWQTFIHAILGNHMLGVGTFLATLGIHQSRILILLHIRVHQETCLVSVVHMHKESLSQPQKLEHI